MLSPNQKKALLNKLLTNKITTDEYNEKITTSATNKAIRFKMATFAKAKYIQAEERFIDTFNSIEDYDHNKQSSLQNAQEERNKLKRVLNH